MSHTRMKTALLGSGAAIAMVAVAVPAAADELDDLRGQIEALQIKLATLEQNQVVDQQQAYVAAPANAVVGGDKPGSFRLPGSNTSVAIGGYAKLDLIYDLDNDIGDSFGSTGISLDGTSDDVDNTFRLHARQSRIWIKTWTPTDWGEFSTHIEGDFEGAGGNQLVSNSTALRLRHAYGQLGNILAGQTWSNFNTPWAWAGTIDFNGAVGTSFLRQAQLRYTASLGNGMSLAVSIENPEGDGVSCVGGTFLAQCNTTTGAMLGGAVDESLAGSNVSDSMPDIVVRLQWGADWGTVALAAVGRYVTAHGEAGGGVNPGGTKTLTGADDSAFGWGIKFAGVFKLWGKDSVGVEAIYGDGIGRYGLWNVRNGWVFNTNAAGTAVDIDTIQTWAGNIWLEHWWTDNLYSVASFSYGEVDDENSVIGASARLQSFWDFRVNLQWQPVPRANIGIEWIHSEIENFAGADGDADRIQIGFTWGFST